MIRLKYIVVGLGHWARAGLGSILWVSELVTVTSWISVFLASLTDLKG